ncbi:exosortase F system-associated membrane protein [Chryseobacterium sp. MFBS3-17]|uniref:exosortase F system-associated membrane protein n=1 Tax=Chryseobacterium sp. MFBS3-17 TaxID=2886689 RepID=UPI001D0E39CE|nr:exosortase F system-associated protein [Chryseobacterium sp. MFBS3-17]MCC2590585.1 exosortase F system-associated protein [Chryseobacterium sp. MFBS3-17]
MKKIFRWFMVLVGICGLIAVRVIENHAFYDPFIGYFKETGLHNDLPEFDWSRLILHHVFRFMLNVAASAVIIHFMFLNKKWTVQAVALMLIFFAICLPVYLYCIATGFAAGEVFSFYMRRFVIQPLILLLIIPMFYYRKHIEE